MEWILTTQNRGRQDIRERESEGEIDKKMNESVEWVTQWLYNGIVYDDEHL